MQSALDRSLTKKEKDVFLKEINELMFEGDLTKLVDGKRSDAFVKTLKDKGLDEKLLLRSDGTSVYMTQDIGTSYIRYKDFKFDEHIYVEDLLKGTAIYMEAIYQLTK